MNKIVFLGFLILTFHQINAGEVKCEKNETFDYNFWGYGTAKTCFMQHVTAINSSGVTIFSPRDDMMGGLQFKENKKIRFLPVKIAEKFPNLWIYLAHLCSVQEVSKANFENLIQMKVLVLNQNDITTIYHNTFEDLTSLELLQLRKKFQFLDSF